MTDDSDPCGRHPLAKDLLTVCSTQKRVLLGVCPRAGSRGTQAFRPPAAPYVCTQRHPFMSVYKAAHSPSPLDPAAPGRFPKPLLLVLLAGHQARAPPTAAHSRPGSFPTPGTLRQLLIGPAHKMLFLIGQRCAPGAGSEGAAAITDWSVVPTCGRGCPADAPPPSLSRPRPLDRPGRR